MLIGLSYVSRIQINFWSMAIHKDYDDLRFVATPTLRVHNDELLMFSRKDWIKEPNYNNKNSRINLQLNFNKNKLSSSARRKASKAIKYLIYNSSEKTAYNPKFDATFKFKVNFITLTISSDIIHTDQEIVHACLNQFLIEAKRKWNLSHYVWKKEYQKNGRLHFHILTNVWIPWLELRNTWNRIQNKLGYIDRWPESRFNKNPNSTDVHSLKKIKNVPAYVLKYMVKEGKKKNLTISKTLMPQMYPTLYVKNSLSWGVKKYLGMLSNKGRVWTCSHSLSNITGGEDELSDELVEEVEKLQKENGSRRIDKEFFSLVYFNNYKLNAVKFPLLYKLFNDYRLALFPERVDVTIYNSC